MGIEIAELCKLTCAVVATLCSVVLIGTIIELLRQLQGCCLLFPGGEWITLPVATNASEDRLVLALQCGSSGFCNLSILIGVFSALSAIYYIFAISRNIVRQKSETWMHCFGSLLHLILLLSCLVGGLLVLQLGSDAYCKLITAHAVTSSCSVVEYSSAIHKNFANKSSIDPDDDEWKVFGGAYLSVVISLVCNWLVIASWFFYISTCSFQLAAAAKRERFADTFRRERDRLWKQLTRTRFYTKFNSEAQFDSDGAFAESSTVTDTAIQPIGIGIRFDVQQPNDSFKQI